MSKPRNSQHLASHLQKNWRVVRKKGDVIENSLSTAKRDGQDMLVRAFSWLRDTLGLGDILERQAGAGIGSIALSVATGAASVSCINYYLEIE